MKKISDLFAKSPIQGNVEISAFLIGGSPIFATPPSLLITLHVREPEENSFYKEEPIDLVFKKFERKLSRFIKNVHEYIKLKNISYDGDYFMYCFESAIDMQKRHFIPISGLKSYKEKLGIIKSGPKYGKYVLDGTFKWEFSKYQPIIYINYFNITKCIRHKNKLLREDRIDHNEQQEIYAKSLVDDYINSSGNTDIVLDGRDAVVNFLLSVLPDVRLVNGANELRAQYAAENITSKPKYADRQLPIEPMDFLIEHHGKELREGNLGAGTLQRYDRALYSALERRVSKMDGRPSVQQYFDSLKDEGKGGSPTQRRFAALADILDTSREEAASFFSSIRPDRLPPEIGEGDPARPGRPSRSI